MPSERCESSASFRLGDRYRLLSWLVLMRRFHAEGLFRLAEGLGLLAGAWGGTSDLQTLSESSLKDLLRLYLQVAGRCGLKTCEALAFEKRDSLPPHATLGELRMVVETLRDVMRAELEAMMFLWVPPDRVEFWEDPQNVLPAFGNRGFRRVQRDLGEARRCLACARPTAVVFHLMRMVEVGLDALKKDLALPLDLECPNWNVVLNAIEKHGPTVPRWKEAPEFYAGVAAHLRQIRNAYRNPVMHVRGNYSEEEAETLYTLVVGFLTHLSTRVRAD